MISEYLAMTRPSLHAVGVALEDIFTLGPVSTSSEELTFYDTFDGLLRAKGMTVAVATGEEIPESARLRAGNRALLPLATVSVTRHVAAVLDELEKTVARMELLEPRNLSPRLVVSGLRGYEAELERMSIALALPRAQISLRDEAIMAAGGRPEGVSAKVAVELDPAARADVGVAEVLAALWEVTTANLEGTIADTDVEFLHDFRVSVRKTRAVLKQFGGVFTPPVLAHWRTEFKWLQEITGDARDLDVYLEDFDDLVGLVGEGDRAALAPLKRVLEQRRTSARRAMVRELRGPRAEAFDQEWGDLLVALSAMAEDDRPDAARPIDAVASARTAKVYRRMVKMGAAIDDASPADDLHELRKKGKELRYLLELFGAPLHDEAVVGPMVKALKSLQDVLGRHQDREVQAATVRSLADDVAARPGGPDALIAMGTLIRALGADERAARREFTRAFAAFSSEDQQRLVRKTFRS